MIWDKPSFFRNGKKVGKSIYFLLSSLSEFLIDYDIVYTVVSKNVIICLDVYKLM